MSNKGHYSFIIGKSLLKDTIETDLSIIKNKNTILNHICIEWLFHLRRV